MQNLCGEDFYVKTPYNAVTKTQIWLSQVGDSHDNFCHCQTPYAHLLASIFPPGHQDRNKTIEEILQRDYKEKCHSSGDAETRTGMADSGDKGLENIKEEDIPEEGIEDLLAAAAAVEEEDTR